MVDCFANPSYAEQLICLTRVIYKVQLLFFWRQCVQ